RATLPGRERADQRTRQRPPPPDDAGGEGRPDGPDRDREAARHDLTGQGGLQQRRRQQRPPPDFLPAAGADRLRHRLDPVGRQPPGSSYLRRAGTGTSPRCRTWRGTTAGVATTRRGPRSPSWPPPWAAPTSAASRAEGSTRRRWPPPSSTSPATPSRSTATTGS